VPASVAVVAAANAAALVKKSRRSKLDMGDPSWERTWERHITIIASEARSLEAPLSAIEPISRTGSAA
jgi:hypothetical protein